MASKKVLLTDANGDQVMPITDAKNVYLQKDGSTKTVFEALTGEPIDINITDVDDAISPTSTNPVQNKKVKEYVDNSILDVNTFVNSDPFVFINFSIYEELKGNAYGVKKLILRNTDDYITFNFAKSESGTDEVHYTTPTFVDSGFVEIDVDAGTFKENGITDLPVDQALLTALKNPEYKWISVNDGNASSPQAELYIKQSVHTEITQLSRDRNAKFELIDSYICTDDLSVFTRTSEPDGTPYNFSKLLVVIRSKANAANAGGYFRINTSYTLAYATKMITTTDGYQTLYAEAKHGRLFGECTNVTQTIANANSLNATSGGLGYYEGESITKLELSLGSGGYFKTGSVITIYGVRK